MKYRIIVLKDGEIERFWSKVEKSAGLGPNGDCWEWIGLRDKHGYGRHARSKAEHFSHRMSWFLANSLQPEGAVLHRCDNPPCCNPDHLWLGDQDQNMKDMAAKGRGVHQRQTSCKRGHEYSEANTRVSKGGSKRQCRKCDSIRQKEYQARKLA